MKRKRTHAQQEQCHLPVMYGVRVSRCGSNKMMSRTLDRSTLISLGLAVEWEYTPFMSIKKGNYAGLNLCQQVIEKSGR